MGKIGAHGCCAYDLGYSARNSDPSDFQQVFQGKMEADPKHQHDYADFGELLCDIGVCVESGGMRAYQDARDKIPCNRWDAQLRRNQPAGERETEANGDRRDNRQVMFYGGTFGREGVISSILPSANA